MIPHVWYTKDSDGAECRHLSLSKEGAIQAHLLHFGMMYHKGIEAVDEGTINKDTDRKLICFDPNDALYALSFDENGKLKDD